MRAYAAGLGLAALVGLSGCDEDAGGTGVLELVAYGEEFLENGIDSPDMADGWSITFEGFKVNVLEVTVAGEVWTKGATVDLLAGSAGAGVTFGSQEFPSGTHDSSAFLLGERTISGRATKGSVTKRFEWSFLDTLAYDDCDTPVRVPIDSQGIFEITLLSERLFSDSLSSNRPTLRFDPIADADADNDGTITEAELTNAPLGNYDADDSSVSNLWGFLQAQAGRMARVNGDGLCRVSVSR